MGVVDNVDNVYLKIIRYHIYCIYIQWCISTLLSGANLKLWSKVPTLSTTRPRQNATFTHVDNVDNQLTHGPHCPHYAP
jgi:hypothetical protein